MESPDHSSSIRTRQFKRSYVACVSCRARKSRCIIKDNPPCAKCAREHRECRFDRRPRAPKHRDAPEWTRRNVMDVAPVSQTVQAANPSPSEDLGFNSSPNNTNNPLGLMMHWIFCQPLQDSIALLVQHHPKAILQPATFSPTVPKSYLVDLMESGSLSQPFQSRMMLV
jgi:hypothetical protein